MADIHPWPKSGGPLADLPRPVVRPCDHGLLLAIYVLEAQLGTVEAYNRIVAAAAILRAKIERGQAVPQNPVYAVHPRGEPPR